MIAGIIFGLLVGLCLAALAGYGIYHLFYWVWNKGERTAYAVALPIAIFVGLAITVLLTYVGTIGRNADYQKDIAKYEATKTTYEQSIKNVDLGGLERLEIVNTAIDMNQWLAEAKVNMTQWFTFDIQQDIKDKVIALPYIGAE
jgi:MFS family permease